MWFGSLMACCTVLPSLGEGFLSSGAPDHGIAGIPYWMRSTFVQDYMN